MLQDLIVNVRLYFVSFIFVNFFAVKNGSLIRECHHFESSIKKI